MNEDEDTVYYAIVAILAFAILFYAGLSAGVYWLDNRYPYDQEKWGKFRLSVNVEDCRRMSC